VISRGRCGGPAMLVRSIIFGAVALLAVAAAGLLALFIGNSETNGQFLDTVRGYEHGFQEQQD
jgi:hypothetical protein